MSGEVGGSALALNYMEAGLSAISMGGVTGSMLMGGGVGSVAPPRFWRFASRGTLATVKNSIRIVERDGTAVRILASGKGGEIEIITDIAKQGDDLLLTGLHMDGPGAGRIGLRQLRQFARDFGRLEGAQRVMVKGGIRTTGANPGRVPRRLTFKVD